MASLLGFSGYGSSQVVAFYVLRRGFHPDAVFRPAPPIQCDRLEAEWVTEDLMSINGPEELAGMRVAGAIVRCMLEAMKKAVRPGVTTSELDEVGATVMRERGAQSAPQLVYKFPGVNCISLNEEAVHGIPGDRTVREGDLVKLDVTIEKDGFMADAGETVVGGKDLGRSPLLVGRVRKALPTALM